MQTPAADGCDKSASIIFDGNFVCEGLITAFPYAYVVRDPEIAKMLSRFFKFTSGGRLVQPFVLDSLTRWMLDL